MRHPVPALAVLALCATLAACGTETAAPGPSGPGSTATGELPDAVPVPGRTRPKGISKIKKPPPNQCSTR